MAILHLNIEGEDLWYLLEVEPETYSFYAHLHESTLVSSHEVLDAINTTDGKFRLSRTLASWEAQAREELALYDRVVAAKLVASRLLQE